jgi:hypothetical protein
VLAWCRYWCLDECLRVDGNLFGKRRGLLAAVDLSLLIRYPWVSANRWVSSNRCKGIISITTNQPPLIDHGVFRTDCRRLSDIHPDTNTDTKPTLPFRVESTTCSKSKAQHAQVLGMWIQPSPQRLSYDKQRGQATIVGGTSS